MTDGGVLHVTNGDAAVTALRARGVEGPILPWRDTLHEGPVPAVPRARLRELRAEFLAGEGGLRYGEVLADLGARDDALAAAGRLVLWFEHDLYDQLQLVQVLASSDAADFVTARWLGGVEIVPPRPAWRWDAAHRCLVTMLAA